MFATNHQQENVVTPNAIAIGIFHSEPIKLGRDLLLQIRDCNKRKVVLWYEGAEPENIVSDFIQIYNLKGYLRSWEPKHLPEEGTIALDLWGGDFRAILNHIGKPKGTLAQALVAASPKWHGSQVDERALTDLCMKAGLDRLLEQPFTHTTFSFFHTDGMNSLKHRESPLHELFLDINDARERNLSALFRGFGGVFFVGNDHISSLRQEMQ